MFSYWGKYWRKTSPDPANYHLLVYHLLDVAAVGTVYLQNDSLIFDRLSSHLKMDKNEFLSLVTFFLAIHDLGKFSESFQNLNPELFFNLKGRRSNFNYPLRHDTLGQRIWNEDIREQILKNDVFRFPPDVSEIYQKFFLNILTGAVFGHHGIPPEMDKVQSHTKSSLYTDQDVSAAAEFITTIRELYFAQQSCFFQNFSKETLDDAKRISWVFAGLAVFSDWIASDESNFPFHSEQMSIEKYWTNIALPQAQDALRRSGILPCNISQKHGIEELFHQFKDAEYAPSDAQLYASSYLPTSGPHLFIIEESTGSGKTEAAITLAHQLMTKGLGEGFYFALPTMATSNAMFDRIRVVAPNLYAPGERPSIVLAHSGARESKNFLSLHGKPADDLTGSPEWPATCTQWLADNRKKALLAPVGIGTIDQALVSVLPRRHQSLRFFGILKNILIVDEVHAYDEYMNGLLRSLLTSHAALGGSAILLSATLPKIEREKLVRSFSEGLRTAKTEVKRDEYPLITHVSRAGLEEIPLSPRPGTSREVKVSLIVNEDEVIEHLLAVIRAGKCACWIRNTVQDALDAYTRLHERVPSDRLMLFHARYAMGDRLDIEKKVLRKFGKGSKDADRAGMVLIATQVVEQSLDLDFDHMVTDLAPIDLIIQRAGRLHRHPREGRTSPELWIFSPTPEDSPDPDWYKRIFPRASYVYPKHGDLWLTARILSEHGRIKTPEEARLLMEGVFSEEVQQQQVPEGLRERDQLADNERRRARDLAMMNSLNFKDGYRYTGGRWPKDEDTPTRLSEPSVTLRLGEFNEDTMSISPIYNTPPHAWYFSQVSVMENKLHGGIIYPKDILPVVERTTAVLPDGGRTSTLVPLKQQPDGNWGNVFRSRQGKNIEVVYSREMGLTIGVI